MRRQTYPKSKVKKLRPLKRKLHVGNDVWTYRVVHDFVDLRSPDNKQNFRTTVWEVTGIAIEDWFPDNDGFPISIDIPYTPPCTPSEIKQYLIKQVLPKCKR